MNGAGSLRALWGPAAGGAVAAAGGWTRWWQRRSAAQAQDAAADGSMTSLVRAAREGDRRAFAALHDRYARMVHGILLARVPPQEAGDLVQDVFLAALQRLDGLREDGAFGAWLAEIARNRAGDFHRAKREHEEVPEDLAHESPKHAEVAEVLAAIRSLPTAYSETLMMRLVEGMTGPEIAERTGLTHASVRVNLHRGMKMVRENLGEEQHDE